METAEELEEKLSSFKDKYAQVEFALKQAPESEALEKVKTNLLDVISLTENLLKLKRKPQTHLEASKLTDTYFPSENVSAQDDAFSSSTTVRQTASSAPRTLTDAAAPAFRPGSHCLALWREDGNWYEAVVNQFDSDEQHYKVTFVGYGNSSVVSPAEVALLAASNSSSGVDTTAGLANSKLKRPKEQPPPPPDEEEELKEEEFVVPDKLRILPTDSEEVRQTKRRKIHAMKSQFRKKKMEKERNSKKMLGKNSLPKRNRKPALQVADSARRASLRVLTLWKAKLASQAQASHRRRNCFSKPLTLREKTKLGGRFL